MGMTDRDRKLLAVFAVAVLLGGYWFLILGKKRAAVADAEQAKITAQQKLDTAKQSEAAGKRQKKVFPVSYSRVVRLGKAIPGDSDMASLLVQVNDIATQSGVSFVSLTSTEGASASGGSTGATGIVTTCGGGGASSATAASAAPGASAPAGASAPTGTTGPTQAHTALGQDINNAKAATRTASADANRAAGSNADAAKCAKAPTMTDLAAVQSGLAVRSYSFNFLGNFFNLHNVMHRLLAMVQVHNGNVTVTGRLLQINSISLTAPDFPDLTADVEMTGYTLPSGTSVTAGASSSAPAGAPASSPAPSAAPGPSPAAGAQ